MIGHEFDGQAIELDTPNGGKVTVGLGALVTTEGADPIPAVATRILDAEGHQVAEYALTLPTFGVYMEALKTVFERLPK
jgi:hypothetical protein